MDIAEIATNTLDRVITDITEARNLMLEYADSTDRLIEGAGEHEHRLVDEETTAQIRLEANGLQIALDLVEVLRTASAGKREALAS